MTDGGGWGWGERGWGVGGEGGHDMEVIHSRLCRQILVVGRASRIVRS